MYGRPYITRWIPLEAPRPMLSLLERTSAVPVERSEAAGSILRLPWRHRPPPPRILPSPHPSVSYGFLMHSSNAGHCFALAKPLMFTGKTPTVHGESTYQPPSGQSGGRQARMNEPHEDNRGGQYPSLRGEKTQRAPAGVPGQRSERAGCGIPGIEPRPARGTNPMSHPKTGPSPARQPGHTAPGAQNATITRTHQRVAVANKTEESI